MGFNLKFAGPLEICDGGLANLGSRHAIWVDRDGLFTYGVNAGPAFLGWGVNENRHKPPYFINSLALVETTLEFFRIVYLVFGPRVPAGAWRFRIAAHRWKQSGLAVVPGPPEAVAWAESPSPATCDELLDEFDGTGAAPKDAFLALERVYGMFGMPPQDISFAGLLGSKWVDLRRRSAGKQLVTLVSGVQGGLGSGAASGTGCGEDGTESMASGVASAPTPSRRASAPPPLRYGPPGDRAGAPAAWQSRRLLAQPSWQAAG